MSPLLPLAGLREGAEPYGIVFWLKKHYTHSFTYTHYCHNVAICLICWAAGIVSVYLFIYKDYPLDLLLPSRHILNTNDN